MKKSKQIVPELLIVIIVYLAVNLLTARYQKVITYNEGAGWDGKEYVTVARQFARSQTPAARTPFVHRLGTPFVVSRLFPDDILHGFLQVNRVAGAVLTLLMLLWLHLYLRNWKVRMLLIILFITQWHNWIRFVYFYPAHVDPWTQVFILAGLILLHFRNRMSLNRQVALLSLLTAVGVFFRETVLIIPLVFLFLHFPWQQLPDLWEELRDEVRRLEPVPTIGKNLFRRAISWFRSVDYRIYLPLLPGLVGIFICKIIARPTTHSSFFNAALYWLYIKSPMVYLHSFFTAFGPLVVLFLFRWKKSFQFLKEENFHLIFFLIILVLAYIGGEDMYRFFYWAVPIVFVVLGKLLEKDHLLTGLLSRSSLLVAALVVLQAVSQRLFWTVPDYPPDGDKFFPVFLTILSSKGSFLKLHFIWTEPKYALLSFYEYLLIISLLLLWLYREKRRMVSENGEK